MWQQESRVMWWRAQQSWKLDQAWSLGTHDFARHISLLASSCHSSFVSHQSIREHSLGERENSAPSDGYCWCWWRLNIRRHSILCIPNALKEQPEPTRFDYRNKDILIPTGTNNVSHEEWWWKLLRQEEDRSRMIQPGDQSRSKIRNEIDKYLLG